MSNHGVKTDNHIKSGSRRLTAFILSVVAAIAAVASPAVDTFVASPLTDDKSVSVYIYDLASRRLTDSYNESTPLIPASITKALTIASCLQSTGTDYRYHTRVYTDGSIKDGTLDGNVIIIGSGDPSLGSKKEPMGSDFVLEVVKALKQQKIKHITGQILFDQSIFPLPAHPESWCDGDKSQSYGTGCYGFNYGNNSSGSGAVSNPAAVFDNKLKDAFSANSITIDNSEKPQTLRTLLTEHVSPPIDDIMRSCIRRSDNLYAEAILRTYALENNRTATSAEGAALEMDFWRNKGVDMTSVNVVDGSGLSRQNRMTAKFLGQVLQKMAEDVDFVSYFPLAGQEGTLRKFLKDTALDSYIALKTGSMNGIQCYAGYKLDYDFAPTHVVVVMINNMSAKRSSIRREVEKMLLEIFKDA